MKGICTVLGTGTSQGVPVIACDCHVCASEDPRDNRTRTAVMLSINDENHVIDAGPDFRHQMLREKVKTLKSVIFTHEHKDHVAGLDDVRAFNFKEKRHINVYANAQVEIALRKEYHYIFSQGKGREVRTKGVRSEPEDLQRISYGDPHTTVWGLMTLRDS